MSLIHYREKQNLTQKQLSNIMKVSQPTISKWENKKIVPNAKTMLILANALQVDVQDIINCFIDETEKDKGE